MKIETVVRELTSLASMIISPTGRTLIASAKGELLIQEIESRLDWFASDRR